MPLLIAGALVATLSLVPIGYVLYTAAALGPSEAADFLLRPRIGELLFNTVRLLLAAVALSLVLGVGCAWLVERRVQRRRGLWHGLLCAPLAVPAFVNGYAWVATTTEIQSFAGAVVVVSLSYYPLIYLPTVAALRRIDPGLEDVASLTAKQGRVFTSVVLPLISPAVLGGALLVALHLLAEYGALQLLNYPTLTTSILDQYRTTFNGPAAALLAAVLAVFCLALGALELSLTRRTRHRVRVGAGVSRAEQVMGINLVPTARRRGGRARTVAAPTSRWLPELSLTLVVAVALGVPLVSLTRWLVKGTSARWEFVDLMSAASSTLSLALTTGLVATALALPVIWLEVRYRSGLTTFVERSTYLASSLPGIVVALALVTASLTFVPVVYQTAGLLIAAYVILFLPRAIVSLRPSAEMAEPLLEDVARSLGASPAQLTRRVTLPLMLPGLTASVALVALAVTTELTATLLLSPIGTTTLATQFFAAAAAVEYGAAAPYAVTMIAMSVPATWWLSRMALGTQRRSKP